MSTSLHYLKQLFDLRTFERKKNSSCQQHCTRFFCLLLFLTSFHLQAQVVEWNTTPPSPSLSSPIIGIGCEDVTLNLIFSISVHPGQAPAELAKPKQIRLELPEGITAVSAIKGAGGIGDFTPGAIEQNGTEVTVSIPTIPCNTQVHLAITLRAGDCEAPAGERVVSFSILSNGSSLPEGSQTIPLEVVQPDITAVPVNATPAPVAYNTEVPFEIPLSVTNSVSIASMKITIQKENFVTLSDFYLGDKIISPEIDSNTVILNLTPGLIDIPISGSAPQTLKFKAQSSVSRNSVISATCDFPLTSACFSKKDFFEVMLSVTNSTETGAVRFELSGNTAAILTANPSTGELMPLAFDASNANYYRPQSMQNGTTSPTITRLRVSVYESLADDAYKVDSYIDEDLPIYYAITPTTSVNINEVTAIDKVASNCIYSDTLPKTGHMRLLKDEFLEKCSRVTFDILDPIPSGHYVHVYVPHVIGETFDNSSWEEIPVIYNERGYHITGNKIIRIETDFSWNVNGDALPVLTSNSMGRTYHSTFTSSALGDIVTSAGEQITTAVPYIAYGIPSSYAYYFYVQLPEWLELVGSPRMGTNSLSPATPVLLTSGSEYFDAQKNTYKMKLNSMSINGNITFTYRAKANGSNPNEYNYEQSLVSGDIRYWVDWDTGNGIENDLRPIIHYVSKSTHKITCSLGSTEISLDEFRLQRITRGLAVKGAGTQSRVPADATEPSGSAPLANLDIIDSETYLPGDTGRVEITTTILQPGFKYLYVLLNSDYLPYFNFTDFSLSESLIKISGTGYQADQISQSGNKLYIRFPAPTATFPNNTPFDIVIPFKAGYDSVLISLKDLQASVSVTTETGDANTDHFNPPSQDLKIHNWRIHYPFGLAEAYNYVQVSFSSAAANQFFNIFYVYNITDVGNRRAKGQAYPNEYRPYWHPHQVTMTVPSGLAIPKIGIRPYSYYSDVTTVAITEQTISTYTDSIPNSDGTVSYVYDISSIFDFEADSYEKVEQAIMDGKWIAPDDVTGYFIDGYFTPLPSLGAGGYITAELSCYTRPSFDTASDTTFLFNRSFVNTTPSSGVLNIPVDSIPTYDKSITVPSITATINGGNRDAWLYVDGDISNMTLYNKTTMLSLTPTEDGWIPLGSLGATQDIELKYTLNSSTDTQIDIYLIADFLGDLLTTPTVDIATFMANDGRRYLGGKRTVKNSVSTNSALQGSIVVPAASIEHDADYPVIFSLHSKTGEANVINPVATVTIPAGQILQTAEYEYPAGSNSWTSISLSDITDNGSQLIIETSKFSAAPFTLYGNRVSGKTDNDRTLNIRLTFKPDCNTELNGFFYWVSYAGTNLVGNPAKGANIRSNVPVYAKVSRNYAFSTSISLPGYAFGGNIKNRVLQADVNKYNGLTTISATDYLEILLPAWLDLEAGADITMTSNIPAMNSVLAGATAAVSGNALITENIRRITVLLPASILNDTENAAYNTPFSFHIPLDYREDRAPNSWASPEQILQADVYTQIAFGTCQNITTPFGSDAKDIALLTLKSDNPYLYNMASIGKPFNLRVSSNGFSGGWYANENLTDQLSGNVAYIHPSRQTPDTVMVYIKADFSRSYGNIPVTLRTPPVNLYWRTNAADTVWVNPANWTTGNANDNDMGYLPALATTAILPSGVSTQYPVLTDTMACGIINFAHGAELGRQDLLIYDSARIQLNLDANQWYMFSPPLHNMYSGDFYREDPDPYVDEQTAYTVRFSLTNPETGSDQTGEWTGAFNTPDVELGIGSGLAIWIDKHGTAAGQHPEIPFDFPKHDTEHHLYNPDRYPPGNISKTYSIDRSRNGRFIYEGAMDGQGNVALPVGGAGGEAFSSVLIGNPFMSHLNFTAFHADNNGLYSRGYKLVHGAGAEIDGFYSYLWNESANKYISTDPSGESSGLIPPMQSFVVEVNSGTGSLNANIRKHTAASVEQGDAFRDAGTDASSSGGQLNILAVRSTGAGTEVSKAIVLQDASYATHYVPSEDSYKLFVSKVYDSDDVVKHVQLYTRSSDGYALDINCIGTSEQDITIPLCLRTSEKGEIVLNFSGMDSFGESTGIYLYDAQHPERLIDLKTQPEYAFEKTENELYLENRLSLVIGKALQPLGLETVSEPSAVRVLSLSPRTLRIVSASGKALGNVRITDAWGRIVLNNPAVSSSTYEYQTPTPGIYIVRVGAAVKKVVSIR